jgi:hypothetical protein
MNVTLPDGTVITNVPDDITKEQLDQKLQANGIDVSKFQPTFGQQVLASPAGRFIQGAGGVIDAGAQLLPRALSGVSSLGGLNPNPISQYLDEEAKKVDEIVAQKARTMEAAKQATGQTGVDISKFAGEALTPTNIAMMKYLQPMSKTLPGLIEAGGYMGAVGGALSPVTENQDNFSAQKAIQMGAGAALGSILPGVVPVISKGYQLAKALGQPFTETGREKIVGSTIRSQIRPTDVGDVVNRLSNAEELVPGSTPTAAEVAESGGISALQRSAAARSPDAYSARATDQANARLAAIDEIAGTGGKKEFFSADRKAVADQLYEEAKNTPLDFTNVNKSEIDSLLKRPAIKSAIEKAKELAANAGYEKLSPKGSIRGLDYVKEALDLQIIDAKGKEKEVLRGVKDDLLSVLDRLSPKYAEARATFEAMSKPINRMEVAETLRDKLIPAISDLGAINKETPASFAAALRNADETAKRATGYKDANLQSIFADSPAELQTIENIGRDIARKANFQDLARGAGSDTFQKMAMANMAEKSGIPLSVLEMPILNFTLKKLYDNPTNKMQEQLAQVLLNPQLTAKLIAQAAPQQRSRLMAAALQRQLTPAMFGASTAEFLGN